MSHIADLISHHCPNGVKFKALKDVARIIRGERVTKTELLENEKYLVVSGGTGYMDIWTDTTVNHKLLLLLSMGLQVMSIGKQNPSGQPIYVFQ